MTTILDPPQVRERVFDSMPEPDLSVMPGTLADFAVRHPTTAALGMEVAVSSVTPDRENAALQEEAKVTEYWIVRAEAQRVEVYRRPEKGIDQEKRTQVVGEFIESRGVIGGDFAADHLFD